MIKNGSTQFQEESSVLVASSPLTKDENSIRRLFKAGAKGVVTKTIVPSLDLSVCGARWFGQQLFNEDGYSDRSLDYWLKALNAMTDLNIVANIFAETSSELADIAAKVDKAGCKAIELGLSCPTKLSDPICLDKEKLYEFCAAARAAAPNTPMVAKIVWEPSYSRIKEIAKTLCNTGLDGIVCSDSFAASVPDRNEQNKLRHGAFSGPAFFFLNLRVCCQFRDLMPNKLIYLCGGIEERNQIEMAKSYGIDGFQVCTSLFRHGINHIASLSTNTYKF